MDNRGSKFLCMHRIKEQRVDGIGHTIVCLRCTLVALKEVYIWKKNVK